MSRAGLPLGLAAVSYARDFVGLREQLVNTGPGVEYFLRQAGLGPGYPWCAAFVNGVIDLACAVKDVRSPFEGTLREAYVQDYVDYARRRTWLVPITGAYPGCLFATWNESLGRYAHIGFVTGVLAVERRFWTVEGNSNEDGGREGHSVVELDRRTGNRTVFIDWAPIRKGDEAPRWVTT